MRVAIGGRRDMQYASHLGMVRLVPTQQIAVRLPVELLAELDSLVESGLFENRAAAVRAGIETLTDADRRRRIDDAIVAGYRRVPPSAEDEAAALASLREAIAEEPW